MKHQEQINVDMELERLERRVKAAALAAMLELGFMEYPEQTKKWMHDFLEGSLTAAELEACKRKGMELPAECSRREILQYFPDEWEVDVPDVEADGSDDSIVQRLCDVIDALRAETEYLRSRLAVLLSTNE